MQIGISLKRSSDNRKYYHKRGCLKSLYFVILSVEFKKNQRTKMTFWLRKCQIERLASPKLCEGNAVEIKSIKIFNIQRNSYLYNYVNGSAVEKPQLLDNKLIIIFRDSSFHSE